MCIRKQHVQCIIIVLNILSVKKRTYKANKTKIKKKISTTKIYIIVESIIYLNNLYNCQSQQSPISTSLSQEYSISTIIDLNNHLSQQSTSLSQQYSASTITYLNHYQSQQFHISTITNLNKPISTAFYLNNYQSQQAFLNDSLSQQ